MADPAQYEGLDAATLSEMVSKKASRFLCKCCIRNNKIPSGNICYV